MQATMRHASTTYEGTRVAVNICIDLNEAGGGIPLSDFLQQPWGSEETCKNVGGPASNLQTRVVRRPEGSFYCQYALGKRTQEIGEFCIPHVSRFVADDPQTSDKFASGPDLVFDVG